jgi:hyperosmotically inducible protein
MRTRKVKQLAASLLVIGSLGGAVAACDLIQGRESAGDYVDDASITTSVKAKLASDSGLGTAAQVHVETMQGVVQLSGFVDKPDQKVQAERIARDVKGVHGVRNNIVVRS